MGEKELLIKDLCARFPYHTMVEYRGGTVDYTEYSRSVRMEDCKPYLRPISDMTRDEEDELMKVKDGKVIRGERFTLPPITNCIDWLIAHHFDYNDLIPKGIALKAREDMYDDRQIVKL